MTDLEIARATKLRPIIEIAGAAGLPADALYQYGPYKAKIGLDYIASLKDKPRGKLILVTAISPTPACEGKTTTTIGLGDALRSIGKRTMIALREPSLGPCFGMKGGATGGGHAQVAPMDAINLHFTGDFHAITSANNLLAALIDNHIYYGNKLGIDPSKVSWRRCMDMNDRALRDMVVALGGNGQVREDAFDITVASEVMAIFCLATSLADLEHRLGEIVVAARQRPPRHPRPRRQRPRRRRRRCCATLSSQPRADAGRHARADPRRPIRQHRAWLQLGDRHRHRAQARRLCRDRSGLRRRSRRGEVFRHQVPAGRP